MITFPEKKYKKRTELKQKLTTKTERKNYLRKEINYIKITLMILKGKNF